MYDDSSAMRIKSVTARQVINAKGHPTLQVEVSTSKNTAFSSVPIAASKSKFEFFDAYDNDLRRFHGETLETIVNNVHTVIAPEFIGKNVMDQDALDLLLLKIDSTLGRTLLGVNTITATSQAIARLGAMESDLPLFKYIRVLHDFTGSPSTHLHSDYKLPKPVITIYKSSSHDTERHIPAQEIMVLPRTSFVYGRDLVPMFDALHFLKIVDTKHTLNSLLDVLLKEISMSGFKFSLGVDMSASRYKRVEDTRYVIPHFTSSSVPFSADAKKLVKAYEEMIKNHKLAFLEDPLAEDEYSAWKTLKDFVESHDKKVELVSDDFTATNLERLEKIGTLECSNNVVIKPSQAGTVTECIHFAQRARKYDQNITVSYRHGDTEDTFISDFAVGVNADYLRSGYYRGSEHNSKLNRLLQIEDSL